MLRQYSVHKRRRIKGANNLLRCGQRYFRPDARLLDVLFQHLRGSFHNLRCRYFPFLASGMGQVFWVNLNAQTDLVDRRRGGLTPAAIFQLLLQSLPLHAVPSLAQPFQQCPEYEDRFQCLPCLPDAYCRVWFSPRFPG